MCASLLQICVRCKWVSRRMFLFRLRRSLLMLYWLCAVFPWNIKHSKQRICNSFYSNQQTHETYSSEALWESQSPRRRVDEIRFTEWNRIVWLSQTSECIPDALTLLVLCIWVGVNAAVSPRASPTAVWSNPDSPQLQEVAISARARFSSKVILIILKLTRVTLFGIQLRKCYSWGSTLVT